MKFKIFWVMAGLAGAGVAADYRWQVWGENGIGSMENWTLTDGSAATVLPGEGDSWNGVPPYSRPHAAQFAEDLTYTINIPGKATFQTFSWGDASSFQRRNVTVDFHGTGELEVKDSSRLSGIYVNGEYFSKYTFKNGKMTMPSGKKLCLGDWSTSEVVFSGMTFDGGVMAFTRKKTEPNRIAITDGTKFTTHGHDSFKFGDSSTFCLDVEVSGEGTALKCDGNSSQLSVQGVGSRLKVKDGAELDLIHGMRTISHDTAIEMTNTTYRQQSATWIGYGANVIPGDVDWHGPSNNVLRVRDTLFEMNGNNMALIGEKAKMIFDCGAALTNPVDRVIEISTKASDTEYRFDGARVGGSNANGGGIRLCMGCSTISGAEVLCHGGSISNTLLRVTANPSNRVVFHSILMQNPSQIALEIPAGGWDGIPLETAHEIRCFEFEGRERSRIYVNVDAFRRASKGQTAVLMKWGGTSGTSGAVKRLMEEEVWVDVKGDGRWVNARDLDEATEGKITHDEAGKTLAYTAPKRRPFMLIIR